MLPSIDTYLQKEIREKLRIILTNRYIIDEILRDMDPTTVRRFMKAYYGENRREIPIMFTMPQEKVDLQGAIYIGLRKGEESDTSIGHHEGVYSFKEGEYLKECSVAKRFEDRLYFEVSKQIGDLNNVENLEFAVADDVRVEGNKIFFAYAPYIEGLEFNINYTACEGEEMGITKGFTADETYSVLTVSTNMDTVRCLDLIVKAILILMRDNPEEQTYYLLQNLQFGQIEEIDTGRGTDTNNPEIVYGRENIISYKVSYGLDSPITTKLEEILVKEREVYPTNG